MRKSVSRILPSRPGDQVLAATRQMWLAGLGAGAFACDWVQGEAGKTFRHLVKEGTVVESRVVAFVGDQVEGSMGRANDLWQRTRLTLRGSARQAADAAVAMVTRMLPKSVPHPDLPGHRPRAASKRAAPAPAARKTARTPVAKRTTAAKRDSTAKGATATRRAAQSAPARKRRTAAVA